MLKINLKKSVNKNLHSIHIVGRDSSVGIVSRYGLDDLGIDSSEGEIFRTRSERPWGSPSLL
jgi:hypothetical protein